MAGNGAPDSWQVLSIGSMLDAIIDYRGKTPPKSQNGIPCLSAANVKGGKIDLSSVTYVSQETYDRWTTRGFPEPGDVLITTEAPVGEVASFPGDRTYLMTRRVMALRGKEGVLDNDFLKYVLLSPEAFERLARIARGTTAPRVLKTDITDLEIPVPPFPEQNAIAAVLGALDDKIELNRRMNATLEAMARALFQSWFVDFDPVRAKLDGRQPVGIDSSIAALFPDSFQDSEVGHIPKGWHLGRLSDLCNLKRGHDLPSSSLTAGPIPVISSSGISGSHSETNIRGPGVVTGRYGTIGKVFYVESDYWPLNTTLYVDDFKANPPRFVFHVLGEVSFQDYTDKAAVPGVNRSPRPLQWCNSLGLSPGYAGAERAHLGHLA